MVSGFSRRVRRGCDGRFRGFRINCEQVPMLPAWAVSWAFNDPRKIPYLLVWKSRWDGKVKEVVRVMPRPRTATEAPFVEVKRIDGSIVPVYLVWRWQPHGGRSLLLRCWRCGKPCRALYGVRVGDDGRFYVAQLADWECRRCAGLRYSSEGGALLIRCGGLLSRLLGQPPGPVSSPRPEPWLPFVFTSLDQAADSGLLTSN